MRAKGICEAPRPARRIRHPAGGRLWVVGLLLRPDYWWNLQNSFAILLNYTEIALLAIGLTYVIANGDIDLSVGAVLALAGAGDGLLPQGHGLRSGASR